MQRNSIDSKNANLLKNKHSYTSFAIMKTSNNSSVTNSKPEVNCQKTMNQLNRKNYSYSPLIKKMISKGKSKLGANNTIRNLLIDNYNLKEKKPSRRTNYDKVIKEKLPSRNSFNYAGISTSIDKHSMFNDSRNKDKSPLQTAYSFTMTNTNHNKYKQNNKILNSEFKRIEEIPNETSIFCDDIQPCNDNKNGLLKINLNNVQSFEGKCEDLFKQLDSNKDNVLTYLVYKEVYEKALKELPELKIYQFINKIIEGYSQLTDSLINDNTKLNSILKENKRSLQKYEILSKKYHELKKKIDFKENELNRMRMLMVNGKERTSNYSNTGMNILSEQVYTDEDNYIFNKKIRNFNRNNLDDLDAMYFPDRVLTKTRSFSADKSKVPKLDLHVVQLKYSMNQLPYANDVNNKLDNIKDLNIESKYYNENKKTGYIMGKAKNNKLQLKVGK